MSVKHSNDLDRIFPTAIPDAPPEEWPEPEPLGIDRLYAPARPRMSRRDWLTAAAVCAVTFAVCFAFAWWGRG